MALRYGSYNKGCNPTIYFLLTHQEINFLIGYQVLVFYQQVMETSIQ